ncbi:DUF4231 domain-containing protein [Streptomyces sp. DT203]|uniref:DUF4231 domain-containing protein n=1 Tax=Streptomyces sp. DT203 TaxID=3393424 RepID=UPI003CF63E2D
MSTLLSVEQAIVEAEEASARLALPMRFARILLFGLAPLLVVGLALGNALVHILGSDWDLSTFNTALLIVLALTLVAGVPTFLEARTDVSKLRVKIRKLHLERDSLAVSGGRVAEVVPPAFDGYRKEVPKLRDDYRLGAGRYRSRHNRFQLVVIVGSIFTSVATTASAEQGFWSWLAVALSSAVSVSAGVTSYFKFRERSINLQQTADSIDMEIKAFDLRIRRYKNLTPEQAAVEFAEEIERIKEEQRKKELQLEQTPEVQRDQSQRNSGSNVTI